MVVNHLIYDQEISEIVTYNTWQEFVNKYDGFVNHEKNYLFRGQSNFTDDDENKNWKPFGLKTTLQRKYKGADSDDLINILDYFIKWKDKYSSLSNLNITNPNNYLPLILYLRHLGIPMPVLDMTFDPLTALFFAVHDVIVAYGVTKGKDENDSRYVSIYEFDKSLLIKHFGAKEVREIKFQQPGVIDTILLITEIEKLDYHNQNMVKQDGAFIFLASSCACNATHFLS